MAVDTAEKRLSMIGLGLPTRQSVPLPGTLDAADRLQLLFLYRGISAEGLAQPTVIAVSVYGWDREMRTVMGSDTERLTVRGWDRERITVYGEES